MDVAADRGGLAERRIDLLPVDGLGGGNAGQKRGNSQGGDHCRSCHDVTPDRWQPLSSNGARTQGGMPVMHDAVKMTSIPATKRVRLGGAHRYAAPARKRDRLRCAAT